jgi:hypothetical protein
VEGGDQGVAHVRRVARRDQRGRLAAGDFLGEAGAAQDAGGQARRDFGADLVAEQAVGVRRGRSKPLHSQATGRGSPAGR